jgi:hypothetical protein
MLSVQIKSAVGLSKSGWNPGETDLPLVLWHAVNAPWTGLLRRHEAARYSKTS